MVLGKPQLGNLVRRHMAIKGSERAPLPGARVVRRSHAHLVLEVTLKLRRKRKLPELKDRPARHIARAVLASKFGASKRDIAKVVVAFARYGLRKIDTNAATRTVHLSGTVSQMEAAFHTRLFDYAHKDGKYRGRVGPLSVPFAVKNIVKGVFGLDNRRVLRRRRKARAAKTQVSVRSLLNLWYSPRKLATRYNFPAGSGRGQAIGLLEFGGGYFAADLKRFCRLVGVRMPKVKVVSVDGTSSHRRDGEQSEVMLDVEVIAGICPKASLIIYFAQWTEQGFLAALDAAVHDVENHLGVLSISWGNAEDARFWSRQAMEQMNETLKEAAYIGVTICVAAGDDGSSDGIADGLAHVDFPGSSPYVLCVGGTTVPPANNKKIPDVVWKKGSGLRIHNGGSTGGGVSAIFPRPYYQAKTKIKSVNPDAIMGRCVPDVAANADWMTSPYLLVVNRKPQPSGGTSASAPLWAALVTLINAALGPGRRVGYVTPVLYRRAGARKRITIGQVGCTDVTSGNNKTTKLGGYSATIGYDAASGWGTPNGRELLSILRHQS